MVLDCFGFDDENEDDDEDDWIAASAVPRVSWFPPSFRVQSVARGIRPSELNIICRWHVFC